MTEQHIVIWGDTPLAAFLAAKIHPIANATWLTNHAHTERLDVTINEQTVTGIRAVREMKAAKKPSMILLACEGWYVSRALKILASFVPPSTEPPPIAIFGLGMGLVSQAEGLFGVGYAVPAVPTLDLQAPDDALTVQDGGRGGVTVGANAEFSEEIVDLLLEAGIPADSEPALPLQWSGVLWGIQGNAIAAILDIPRQKVYTDVELFGYEHRQIAEAVQMMGRQGVQPVALIDVNVPRLVWAIKNLPRPLVGWFLRRLPAPPPLRNDLKSEQGRSNAAYLNGAVALQADAMNLEAPVNHALALTVTDIAEGRALWSQYRGNPQLLFATLRIAIRH